MATTTYQVGDTLYERKMWTGENLRVSRVMLTWTVISVVLDEENLDDDDQPLQVVTLRTVTERGVFYKADTADVVDVWVRCGTWRRGLGTTDEVRQ